MLPSQEDLLTATSLGWTQGIPNVDVRVIKASSGDTVASSMSDSTGKLDLTGIPAGNNILILRRWLTAGERALLPAQDDALGFVAKIRGVPPEVRVPATRKGGLVFTEWAMVSYDNPTAGAYDDGGYVTIANNADTTIFLDGVLLGVATSQPYEIPGARCADRIAFYADPAGLWSAQIYQFPGMGNDYPLRPGERRVIATDAIDHRSVIPVGYNLSNADFEFRGSSDVDNPAVPDLVSVGLREALGGHGLRPVFGVSVWYLALPTDLGSLPRGLYPGTVYPFLRIPAEKVMNVVSHLDAFDSSTPLCNLYVATNLDRETASLLEPTDYGRALTRLKSAVLSDLHWQWTKSSDADFIAAPGRPIR